MNRKQIIQSNEVSDIYDVKLGGYYQKVLIEGKSKNSPVIITLHGGPGTPIPFCVGCRGLFPEFTDKFIMVYWDQLGCGINNREIDDTFTINLFVQMTVDLVKEVKKLFPDNKIYFFATSWGSILSVKAVGLCSDLVDGAVISGQIIKKVFFNDEVMEVLSAANIPQKKMAAIKKADAEHFTSNDLQMISSCLNRYTDAYQNKKGRQAPIGKLVMGLLTSPDYSLKDVKAIMINGYRKNKSIWNEIIRLDLSESLSRVQIPYMILQGDTDIVASTKYVKELVDCTGNSNLRYRIIEHTGHLPGTELMEEVCNQFMKLANAGKDNGKI